MRRWLGSRLRARTLSLNHSSEGPKRVGCQKGKVGIACALPSDNTRMCWYKLFQATGSTVFWLSATSDHATALNLTPNVRHG
eukprot:3208583-Amphidinium_carterae.1